MTTKCYKQLKNPLKKRIFCSVAQLSARWNQLIWEIKELWLKYGPMLDSV